MRIHVDKKKCSGCRICEEICSLKKVGGINPRKARIRIIREGFSGVDQPVICQQCKKPKCIPACPTGALTRDITYNTIKVDDGKCNMCGLCSEACPFGAIRIDPGTGKPLICDLCNGDTNCVSWCPTQALSLLE